MVRMSLIYLVGRYGASAITLVALSLYTRLATPTEYGFFALVMALASALYACFGQWLRQVLLRFATASLHGKDPLPSAIFQGFLVLAAAIAACLLAIALVFAGDLQRAIGAALPVFAVMGVFELGLAWLQLHLRSAYYVSLSLLRTSAAAILGLTFLLMGWGAYGLIIATFAAYVIAATPVYFTTRFGLGRALITPAAFRSMLHYGLPIAVSAAMGAALTLADRAIIAALLSTEAAGLYAAPYDLAMRTLQVLMLAINLAGTPLIIRAYENNDSGRTDFYLARQWGLLWAAALPITVIMGLMPHGIAALLLGPAFRDAGGQLMPLVAAATFLQGLESFYLSFSFALAKKPVRQMLVLLVASSVNIGLTCVLVPLYGIIGAGWATLISILFAFVGSLWAGASLRRLPFSPKILVRIMGATTPMILFLWWADATTQLAAILTGFLALCLYGCTALILDVLGVRRILRDALRARLASSRSAGGIS